MRDDDGGKHREVRIRQQRSERRRRRSYGRTERSGGGVAAAAAVTGDVRETYGAWAMISGHQRFPGRPTLPRRPLLSPTDHRRTNNKISTVTTYPQRLHCLIAIRGGPARGVSQLPTSFPPSLLAPHYGQHNTLSPQLLPPSTGAASAHRPHFNTRNMLSLVLSVQFTFMLPRPIPPKSIIWNNFFFIAASLASPRQTPLPSGASF